VVRRLTRWAIGLGFAAATGLGASTAFAQAGVGIDPGEISGLPPIEADTPVSVAVVVRNPGTAPASYQMLAQPLSGEAELPADPEWFGFEPATFDLDGGAAQEVQVSFRVPEGTDAGDYLALVTAQLVLGEPETSGAQVGAAVATKLYFTVPPAPESSSSGIPTGVIIGIVAGVVVVGGFLLVRRSGLRLRVTRET
jgi:hypothetical protein